MLIKNTKGVAITDAEYESIKDALEESKLELRSTSLTNADLTDTDLTNGKVTLIKVLSSGGWEK